MVAKCINDTPKCRNKHNIIYRSWDGYIVAFLWYNEHIRVFYSSCIVHEPFFYHLGRYKKCSMHMLVFSKLNNFIFYKGCIALLVNVAYSSLTICPSIDIQYYAFYHVNTSLERYMQKRSVCSVNSFRLSTTIP